MSLLGWRVVRYLSVVVVGRAVLLLDILPTGREKGQRVEVLMGRLLATGHQLALVKQLRCIAAAAGSKLHSQHWLLHKGHLTGSDPSLLFITHLITLKASHADYCPLTGLSEIIDYATYVTISKEAIRYDSH